ncbi:MAG: YCF48-related protein [Candidatus Eisenbacteria bacterium]
MLTLLGLACSLAPLGPLGQIASAAPYDFNWSNPRPQGNGLYSLAFESATVGYAVGTKGTTLVTNDGGQSWIDRSSFPNFATHLNDLLVLSPGVLLAAGKAPGLFRSNDGGQSWSAVSTPANSELEDLFRVDASTLFAVGGTRVMRSTDNGASWALRTSPPGSGQIADQFWTSPTRGYILGAFVLKQTTDAGQSWQDVPGVPADFDLAGDIEFLDASTGWIFHDFDTFRTTNGGVSWTDVTHGFGHDPIYTDEVMLLSATHWFAATNGEGALIYETTNAGTDWNVRFSRIDVTGVSEMARLSGGGYCAVTTAGDLLRSDTGTTWINFTQSPEDGARADIDLLRVLDDGHGFAGGSNVWLETNDGGVSWSYAATTTGIAGPACISFVNDLDGLVGGYTGGGASKVARTTDGGVSWALQVVRATYAGGMVALDRPDPNIAYAATYGGTNVNFVFKSTDGGVTWAERMTGINAPHRFFCLDFINPLVGFVAGGDFGAVDFWRTTDGGGQWSVVPSAGITGGAIMAMHWLSATNGVAATDGGMFRTTNGGTSWSNVGVGARSIDFRDALHGVAGTVFGQIAQITSDGGATWQQVDTPSGWYGSSICTTSDGFLFGSRYNGILRASDVNPAAVGGDGVASLDPRWLHGSLGPGVEVRVENANPGSGVRLLVDARTIARRCLAAGSTSIDGRVEGELTVRSIGDGVWRLEGVPESSRSARGVRIVLLERGEHRAALKLILD